jgi:hypothetical protein
MPARRNAASYTASAVANAIALSAALALPSLVSPAARDPAPVCARAARAACATLPALITSTGFLRAAARAADMNLRALAIAST